MWSRCKEKRGFEVTVCHWQQSRCQWCPVSVQSVSCQCLVYVAHAADEGHEDWIAPFKALIWIGFSGQTVSPVQEKVVRHGKLEAISRWHWPKDHELPSLCRDCDMGLCLSVSMIKDSAIDGKLAINRNQLAKCTRARCQPIYSVWREFDGKAYFCGSHFRCVASLMSDVPNQTESVMIMIAYTHISVITVSSLTSDWWNWKSMIFTP